MFVKGLAIVVSPNLKLTERNQETLKFVEGLTTEVTRVTNQADIS